MPTFRYSNTIVLDLLTMIKNVTDHAPAKNEKVEQASFMVSSAEIVLESENPLNIAFNVQNSAMRDAFVASLTKDLRSGKAVQQINALNEINNFRITDPKIKHELLKIVDSCEWHVLDMALKILLKDVDQQVLDCLCAATTSSKDPGCISLFAKALQKGTFQGVANADQQIVNALVGTMKFTDQNTCAEVAQAVASYGVLGINAIVEVIGQGARSPEREEGLKVLKSFTEELRNNKRMYYDKRPEIVDVGPSLISTLSNSLDQLSKSKPYYGIPITPAHWLYRSTVTQLQNERGLLLDLLIADLVAQASLRRTRQGTMVDSREIDKFLDQAGDAFVECSDHAKLRIKNLLNTKDTENNSTALTILEHIAKHVDISSMFTTLKKFARRKLTYGDNYLQCRAINLLRYFGNKGLEELDRFSTNANVGIRCAVIEGLSLLNDKQSTPLVYKLLEDPVPEVFLGAASLFAKFGLNQEDFSMQSKIIDLITEIIKAPYHPYEVQILPLSFNKKSPFITAHLNNPNKQFELKKLTQLTLCEFKEAAIPILHELLHNIHYINDGRVGVIDFCISKLLEANVLEALPLAISLLAEPDKDASHLPRDIQYLLQLGAESFREKLFNRLSLPKLREELLPVFRIIKDQLAGLTIDTTSYSSYQLNIANRVFLLLGNPGVREIDLSLFASKIEKLISPQVVK